MIESKLFSAAKKLVDQRNSFYKRHPKLIAPSVQTEIQKDSEYEQAWDELEKAVMESEQKNAK